MNKFVAITAALVVVSISPACRTVENDRRDLSSTRERELTAGIVKKEIKKGMSGAQVAELLGSPNITTLDENNRETWVYDKIATEASYSESQSGMFLILGGFSNRSGAASTTQRTLTVVIKFNAESKVESFTYHQSKF
jgi:outer membrane protein assembly factor BamE (lipoprotein component of BamABCDE complex)